MTPPISAFRRVRHLDPLVDRAPLIFTGAVDLPSRRIVFGTGGVFGRLIPILALQADPLSGFWTDFKFAVGNPVPQFALPLPTITVPA